jgi:hypothetical protein
VKCGGTSDHNIIKFHIATERDVGTIINPPGFRLIIKEQQRSAFYKEPDSTISNAFHIRR